MKLKHARSSDVAGNALLVTVIFILVLTMSIGGYLTYVMQQARFSSRSQAWNMALAVSEAGIEEGLQHLNADAVGDVNNLSADSWQVAGSELYKVSRNLNSGSFPASYQVQIDFSNSNAPMITAIASVTPPAAARKSSPFFYATATTPNNSSSITNVGRGVRIFCFKPPFFNAAMVAKGSIDLKGNNVTVDSFDSGVATNNVNGQWASSVSGDQGIVASLGGITNSQVNIGNANVYGDLYTSVGEQTNVGSGGFVGTHAWVNSGGTGLETGHFFNDANFTFPDTSFPYTSGLAPSSNTVLMATATNTTAVTNFNTPLLPTGLTNGQTVGPISTNVANITVSAYPGAVPGLVTNISSITTASYPGAQNGLQTNCIGGFITVESDPGQEPCLSLSTQMTNVTTVPSPLPSGGVTTNYNNGGKKVTGYSYQLTLYTYATQLSYTYQILSYTYSTNTYTYTVFAQTPVYATNSYDDVLSGGNYYLTGSLGNTVVTGNSTLIMPNGFNITGTITIAPGGSLTLYVGGTSLSLAGNQVLNQDGLAQNFIVYCAPTVTSISFSGNAAFEGVIVAPNATCTMNGGGSGPQDFSGAIMCDSVKMNGQFNFHYDVALSRVPSPGRFVANSWMEMTNLVLQ